MQNVDRMKVGPLSIVSPITIKPVALDAVTQSSPSAQSVSLEGRTRTWRVRKA